jgi:Uma2 family endonuclease
VFASDLRVRIRTGTAEFYYYPDVTVDCSGLPDHAMFAEHPRVICEVLSVETERIDRGEKLRNYQALPSLEAYVIIDTKQMAVTVYRRERGDWVRDVVADPNASWSLPALGVVVPLSAIYQRSGLQHREPSAP